MVFDVFSRPSDCPLIYEVDFNATSARTLERLGTLRVELLPNGTVVANGHMAPLGQSARVAWDDGRYHGEVSVENLGAWPRSGLVRAQ